MRPHLSTIVVGLFVAGISLAHLPTVSAKTPLPSRGDQAEKKARQSTLSELGIDFGAAELGRYAELDLSSDQKKEALRVVKGRKPQIEKLCDRMTKALVMGESTLEKKRLKETELEAILTQFREVQAEIIKGLHALVTKEQMAKLETMKEREAQDAKKRRDRKSEAAS